MPFGQPFKLKRCEICYFAILDKSYIINGKTCCRACGMKIAKLDVKEMDVDYHPGWSIAKDVMI